MILTLPDDREIQRRLLPELKKCSLVHKGLLARAGPAAESDLAMAWGTVLGELGGDDPLKYAERNLRFLIVGTPGGGTAWLSRLLKALGHPCGHESVFLSGGALRLKDLRESPRWSECSGFASQWLPMIPGVKVVGFIRHPVEAINSMCGHLKWDLEHASEYWCGTHSRDWPQVVHLERPYAFVSEAAGHSVEYVEAVGERIDRNRHDYAPAVSWEDLPLEVRYLANKYGYEKEGLR